MRSADLRSLDFLHKIGSIGKSFAYLITGFSKDHAKVEANLASDVPVLLTAQEVYEDA